MAQARFAVYFAPPPGSPLASFGAAILGYDCHDGMPVPQRLLDGIDSAAAALAAVEPARYGFHATLMAPFELAHGRSADELAAGLAVFAANRAAISIGKLAVGRISSFIALLPTDARRDVAALAGDCLVALDGFRAPMSPSDRRRRIAAGLSKQQIALLDRWGYPYVLDEFRFHMTLAGPLAASDREPWRSALACAFAPLADQPVAIDAVSLVRQDERGARFRVVARYSLTG